MAIATVSAMASNDIAKRIEQLAVAQAVYKLAAAQVSTREPGNLRAEVDEHFREMFDATGGKSFEVRVAGKNVGTYFVKTTKPSTSVRLKVTDRRALMAWCEANDALSVEPDIRRVESIFAETGEVPDGCETEATATPGGEYAGSSLRIDPVKVNDALAGADVLPMLMGGGEL